MVEHYDVEVQRTFDGTPIRCVHLGLTGTEVARQEVIEECEPGQLVRFSVTRSDGGTAQAATN